MATLFTSICTKTNYEMEVKIIVYLLQWSASDFDNVLDQLASFPFAQIAIHVVGVGMTLGKGICKHQRIGKSPEDLTH